MGIKKTPELAAVIAAIRARSGQTMKQFSRETLGVSQATQSRYESGLLTPGHYPLLVLFSLAEGHEKLVIRESLRGVLKLKRAPTDAEILEGLDTAAKVFTELSRLKASSPIESRAHRFSAQALLIANLAASAPNDVPPESVIELLSLWERHREAPDTRRLFEHAVGYLRVHLGSRNNP